MTTSQSRSLRSRTSGQVLRVGRVVRPLGVEQLLDLNARRAELTEVESEGAIRTLHGTVALSKMFGYSTAVRSLSQGRAGFSMSPAGHREVPEEELAARGLVWT